LRKHLRLPLVSRGLIHQGRNEGEFILSVLRVDWLTVVVTDNPFTINSVRILDSILVNQDCKSFIQMLTHGVNCFLVLGVVHKVRVSMGGSICRLTK